MVQLAMPWHRAVKRRPIVRRAKAPQRGVQLGLVWVVNLAVPFIVQRIDTSPPRERFTRRCLVHHVNLQAVRESQKNPLGLWCADDGGHVVRRYWQLYDTLTGRAGYCDKWGFVDGLGADAV